MLFRASSLGAVLAVVLAGSAAAQADDPTPAAAPCVGHDVMPDAENLASVRTATICLVNEERTNRGLGELEPVRVLHDVALGHARHMVRDQFFDHTTPDGATFVSRIKRSTYLRGTTKRWSIGENLAWGTGRLATPAEVVDSWMRSPGHRRNIVTARFTEIGLGVVPGAPREAVGDRAAATYVNTFGERRR